MDHVTVGDDSYNNNSSISSCCCCDCGSCRNCISRSNHGGGGCNDISDDSSIGTIRSSTGGRRSIASGYCTSDDDDDDSRCNQSNYTRSSSVSINDVNRTWEKILYKKQLFEDNYVDETFLDSLITNANVRSYSYWSLCASTVSVTQHLSCLGIFIVAWTLISEGVISTKHIILFDLAMLPLGCYVRLYLKGTASYIIWKGIRSAVVVFGCLWILSPVLQTLTRNFSDDTVFTLTTIFFLLHVALYDYPYIYRNPDKVDDRVTSSIAINAAMFASVLLASRLDTSVEVFAFLFFGIEVFALSPIVRRYIWQRSATFYVFGVTPCLFLVTAILLGFIANIVVHLYILCMFFITFVGPFWLIRSQKYKNEIKGPWDIADVRAYH